MTFPEGAMGKQNPETPVLAAPEAPVDDRLLVKWLEERPIQSQGQLAKAKLDDFLEKASQPRHASGNACIKLCYYIEQCRSSSCAPIREVAFARDTPLRLFDFYVEWNEKNQNRSMRQVLELSSSLVARNPNQQTSEAVKKAVLERTLSIIAHQNAQSLVKPAFKVLECFLSKNTISPKEVLVAFEARVYRVSVSDQPSTGSAHEELWDTFILGVFDWMVLPDISPGAGKFLVTLFKAMKPAAESSDGHQADYSTLWQRWIRKGLAKYPQAFENVKNYLFPPLFKIDRPGSLAFLESLNQQRAIPNLQSQEVDAHALLQLAAMDVGKKAGLVEEPSTIQFQKSSTKKSAACIVLQEEAIGSLMGSFSDIVRSLAFSVLVSSASSIRPFSPVTLGLFQSHLGVMYSDTDAKFRNETLTNSKHMIERIRGATAFLVRELDQVSFKLSQGSEPEHKVAQQALHEDIQTLLLKHKNFVLWYLHFLFAELIPTASYQRHTTSLKAIILLLQSRILEDSPRLPPILANSTIWPFTVEFFIPRSMRLLLDLLMDPFEDVRIGASDVLAYAPRNCFVGQISNGVSNDHESRNLKMNECAETEPILNQKLNSSDRPLGLLTDFILRGKEASRRTGRADYADGVARSYKLLYGLQISREDKVKVLEELISDLEMKVEMAAKDLGQAVLEAPIHASFAALNLVWDLVSPSTDFSGEPSRAWEKWIDFTQRMVRSSSGIWKAVSGILCNDSPEGHLLDDIDESEALDSKDILSYSFRAIHESSNLMRTIVTKINQKYPDHIALPAHNSFVDIGDLSFLQLSTLRHRGAFSTVSLTFTVCCQLTQVISSGSGSTNTDMLRRWWIGTKEAISSQASTTRRSAGIPALITGIMTANAPSPNFEEIMADLKSQAQSPIIAASREQNLPAVHALNGLKDTFKNAAVRKRAEGHVLECVHIASDALNSETWAIRNCGLLLFQALINYLVGTHSKEKTEAGWDGGATAISYDKYPSLGELLLQLLETASDNDLKEASSNALIETIFPVLDILRRAGPPEELRERIVACLFQIIGHKVWQIRELSAKTLCVLVPSEWTGTVQKLIKSCGESTANSSGENQKHGALLGAKLLLERYLPDCDLSSDLQVVTPTLELCFSLQQKSVCSTFGSAAYIDLQNTILDVLIPTSDPSNNAIDIKGNVRDLLDSSFPSNTYLHLTNLLIECSSPVNSVSSTIGRASIAAFKQAVYLSAFQRDVKALEEIVELATNSYGIATLISTLDCISEVWMPAQSEDILYKLATIYINVMKASASAKAPGVRAAALNGLCLMFNSAKDLPSTPFRTAVMELDHVLAIATVAKLPTNPDLCAAVNIMIGISVLSEVLSCKPLQENTRLRVEDWGRYMQMNTRDDKDFDTRFAAARSLQSFFRNDGTESILGNDCLLKALLALHTTLSDDDEEIRELGASTVASLTRNLSTPLQAVQDLAAWMVGNYGTSVSFAHIVVEQMTGADAWKRIKASLDPNDSLFAEEDTNLFVDEVRDTRLWAKTFHGLSKEAVEDSKTKESTVTTLVNWVTAGLTALDTLLEGEDGPLGNTSRPGTYYPCLQVLICQNALIQYMTTHHQGPNSSVDLTSGRQPADSNLLKQFIANAERRRIHEDLIFELLSPDSLQKSRLENLYPSIVNIPRDRLTFSLRLRRARLDLPSPPAGEKRHHSNAGN